MTTYDNRISILSELYFRTRGDAEWLDFHRYNNVGVPLAFLLSLGIVDEKKGQERYVNDSWKVFLKALDVPDKDYDSLDEVFKEANGN